MIKLTAMSSEEDSDPIAAAVRERALHAVSIVQSHPETARRIAESILSTEADHCSTAGLTARWALGRVHYELANLVDAESSLRSAAADARQHGHLQLSVEISLSLAAILVERGATVDALDAVDYANDHAEPRLLGRVYTQRGFVLNHLGRISEAAAAHREALPHLRRENDELGECRTLVNLGVALVAAGRHDEATTALHQSIELAELIGQDLISAAARHALATLTVRQGHLPRALQEFARVRSLYTQLGNPARLLGILDSDESEALFICGLWSEAAKAAERSVRRLTLSQNVVHAAEARLRLARAHQAAGDLSSAHRHAATAAASFHAGERQAWAATAELLTLAIEAQLAPSRAESALSTNAPQRATQLVEQLVAAGWGAEAADGYLTAAETALAIGDTARARQSIEQAQAVANHSPSVDARMLFLEAKVADAQGNLAGALHALGDGVQAVRDFQAAFGATELRANVASVNVRLTELGVSIAVRQHDPAGCFRWSEELRAAALRRGDARPMTDPGMASSLSELRLLKSQRQVAAQFEQSVTEMDNAIGTVERAILDQSRTTGGYASFQPVSITDLESRLEGAIAISYFESASTMFAVVVGQGPARIVDLGASRAITTEAAFMRAALHRVLSLDGPDDRHLGRSMTSLRLSATNLDELLITPLQLDADAHLIVIPCSSIASLCWGAISSLARRDFVLAPSATAWVAADNSARRHGRGGVGIVIGRDLHFADGDLQAIESHARTAACRRGAEATVDASLALFAAVNHLHIAAHGTFRDESPMFSSLEMHDGPLTMFDIERLERVPRTIVLSACDGAAVSSFAANQFLGIASALLSVGVATVIGPALTVRDREVAALMPLLYKSLSSGQTMSCALTDLRTNAHDLGEAFAVTAAMLHCIGASVVVDLTAA